MKNINLSQKSLGVIIFSVLVMLGLLGYWLTQSLQPQSVAGPEAMPKPTLPPPQLTAEELARIQKSATAPDGKNLLSAQATSKIVKTLTAPVK